MHQGFSSQVKQRIEPKVLAALVRDPKNRVSENVGFIPKVWHFHGGNATYEIRGTYGYLIFRHIQMGFFKNHHFSMIFPSRKPHHAGIIFGGWWILGALGHSLATVLR